jgi:hypothetical protein
MVFLALPAAARIFPSLRVWTVPGRARLDGLAARLAALRLPRWLARTALLVFPLALAGAFHLHVLDSPERTFPEGHPFTETVRYMERTRATKAIVSLVFKDYRAEARNRAVLEAAGHFPEIAAVENPYLAEDFILEEAPAKLKADMRKELRSSFRFRRYAAPVQAPRSVGSGVAWEGRALLYVRDSEIGVLNGLREKIGRLCPEGECWVAGTPVSYAEFGDRLRSTLLSSLLTSLILVAGVLVFLAWQLGKGASWPWLLASSFWGPAAMLALVSALRVPINLVTCVFAATLVGLAGDNAVQFLFAARRDGLARGVERLGGASLLVTVAMSAVALCFLGSAFEPPRLLGLLLTAGFVAMLAGDIWIFKGLIESERGGLERP